MNIDYKLREKINGLFHDGKDHKTEIAVYIYLLFNANYKNSNKVRRGQILTSYRALAKITGLSEKQVRLAVEKLIAHRLIEKSSTKHYTVFTLLHYDSKGKPKETTQEQISEKPSEEPAVEPEKLDPREQYYLYLCDELSKRDLTSEESQFRNNYLDYLYSLE